MQIKTFVNQIAFSCNVFVCSGEKGSFIVDLGYYDSEIDSYLKTIPSIDFVIQTHCHFDHIMGLNQFAKKYPEVPVYCFEDEKGVALDSEKNGSLMMSTGFVPDINFMTLKSGTVKLQNYDVKVIHTPGHTIGSCMYFFPEEKILFTGDTIIERSIGRTDLPTGNEADIYRSLRKVNDLNLSGDVMCYFGHGQPFTYSVLKNQNPFLSI